MLSGDLLLDLEQERPHILIGLNRRNGMRYFGDIGGRKGSAPQQQKPDADYYRGTSQTRSIPAHR